MARDPRARFLITADGSQAKRELKSSERDFQAFGSSVKSALRTGALAGAAAAAATTAGIARLTRQASLAAEQLADTSDKLGITTQKLAALQLAARLTGVANEKLTMGMQRMVRRVAEAAQGSGEAVDALKELGLEASDLVKLPLDEQFERVAIAMSSVDNQADKIRLGFKLFDSEGVDLIRTLDVMGRDFKRIEAEAIAFGVAISRVDAEKIAQAGDAVERAETAMLGIGTNIALAIAPIKENLANSFSEAALASEGFKDEIDATMRALVVGVNFAGNSIRGIALAFKFAQLAMLEIQRAKEALEPGARNEIERQLASARKQRERFPEGDPRRGIFANDVAVLENRLAQMDASTVDTITARQDAIGRQIDGLIGKFKTAKEALASYDTLVSEANARAQAAVGNGEGTALQPFNMEALEERQNARRELLVEHAEKTARQIVEIERRAAQERAQIEQRVQAQVTQFREAALSTGIGLLHALGAKSKAFAVAAIAIEKALAIQKILISTRVAAAAALEPPPIGLGPVAGIPLAASIMASGYANAALTGLLGVAQIASLGSGSTGTALGTPTNPVFTDSEGRPAERPQERIVEVHVHGDILTEDRLEKVMGRMFDGDRVIIRGSSRQAATIRGNA